MNQYLTFELDDRRYGVSVEHVNSVLDPQPITPLPSSSTMVKGLTNVRGNVVPVFDPREALRRTEVDDAHGDGTAHASIERSDKSEEGGIVIFEVSNGTLLSYIGLSADKIGKVVNLDESELSPVPDFLPQDAARFFTGFCFIGGLRFSIIDLDELTAKETLFGVTGATEGSRYA